MHTACAKSILTAYHNGMNIYRGCTHGCIYCDVRSHIYGMRHDMTDVEVKINAAQLLSTELRNRKGRIMINTGAMGDPYQPCNEHWGLMRKCMEVVLRYSCGLSVHTKSTRLMRDIDYLEAIGRRGKCVVQVTLTCMDDALSRVIEPHVSTTRERILMLQQLRDRGIPTVVWLCPVLPFLTDSPDNINGIIDACIDAQVKGIICFNMGMTLREGSREHYYKMLDRHFPGMSQRYRQTFGRAYWCLSPDNDALMNLFHTRCKEAGILHDPDAVFAYLQEMPPLPGQKTLFEG